MPTDRPVPRISWWLRSWWLAPLIVTTIGLVAIVAYLAIELHELAARVDTYHAERTTTGTAP